MNNNHKLDKVFLNRLVKIALPIALQGVISASLTLLDNLMVSSLGETELAAIGLATQSFSVEWLVIFGFCSGCGTFFTQFWGIKDCENIKKVTGISVLFSFSFGLLFFIAGFFFPVRVLMLFTNSVDVALLGSTYLKIASINFLLVAVSEPLQTALRETEQAQIPMYISLASFVTDLALNYVLIFGHFGFPKLGLKGAAIATVIARLLELSLSYFAVFVRKNVLSGKIKDYFAFDWQFAKKVLKNSAITTVHETAWIGAVAVQNAAFGHMEVSAYAAVQATLTIMDIFMYAGYSIGDASLIFIGECLGQNDRKEAKSVSVKLIKASITVGIITSVMLMLLNNVLVNLFNLSELGYFYARRLIVVRSICLPFNLLTALMVSGILRAGGDTKFAAVTEISCMWLWSVPTAFYFGPYLGLPVYWAYAIASSEEIVKIAIVMIRYRSGKWMNNMIEGM